MKLSIKKAKIIILLVLICSFLTSCRTSVIVDLINKDTQKFYEKYDLSDVGLKNYEVNDVLVIPYTTQNPTVNNDDKWYSYKLLLSIYKSNNNDSSVVINNVIVEGDKDINLNKINQKLDTQIKFSRFDKDANVQVGRGVLVDEINNQDMNLKDNSKLKVVLNISVEKDSIVTTRDITYIFETRTRRYINQR